MRNQWYVVATASELKHKPLGRQILGEEIVLYRDEAGKAVALVDRCPHRQARLSLGKVCEGRLACPYHGWEFDGDGRCAYVPSLREGEAIPSSAVVPKYETLEQDGYIWLYVGDARPDDHQPFKLPHTDTPGWAEARLEATVANSVDNVIENFIDTTHTGYIHGGLFRKPASHGASAVVRAVADGVIIDIDEEQEQADSLLARLLVKRGDRVTHQDRFVLPSIVQVAYGFGPERAIIGHQICTPVDAFKTHVYVRVTWNLGWLTPLITPFVPLIGRFVLWQDLGVLESQGAIIQRHGKRFSSVPADTANLWIQASRERALRGEPPAADREKRIDYRL